MPAVLLSPADHQPGTFQWIPYLTVVFTCYHNARGEIWIGGPWSAAPLNCVVKNNILVGGPEGVLLKVGKIGTAHLESDYNAMWLGQRGAFAEWDCVRDKSLGETSRSFVGVKHRIFAEYRGQRGWTVTRCAWSRALWTRQHTTSRSSPTAPVWEVELTWGFHSAATLPASGPRGVDAPLVTPDLAVDRDSHINYADRGRGSRSLRD